MCCCFVVVALLFFAFLVVVAVSVVVVIYSKFIRNWISNSRPGNNSGLSGNLGLAPKGIRDTYDHQIEDYMWLL